MSDKREILPIFSSYPRLNNIPDKLHSNDVTFKASDDIRVHVVRLVLASIPGRAYEKEIS